MDRIEKLKTFLMSSPADSFLQHALALEYLKMGDEEGAKKLFEEILTREPGYIGSYYHLGKLLEKRGETAEAIKVYVKGMAESRKAGDNHSYNELQAAHDDLVD
jgi:Tfp pilus assembly protein PilF